jgi:SAM-dependent methyltransferase
MWLETLDQISILFEPVSAAELQNRWRAFVAYVKQTREIPYHLRTICAEIENLRRDRPQSDVAILDHGCGPGSTLIWLAALGYTNISGVDLDSDFSPQNRLMRVAVGHQQDRFQEYDGRRLPFADRAFDLVISQQVLEHVPASQFNSYYAEEGRVLRPGGVAYHQVPHKLVPYDSHSRTWLLTVLPRRVAEPAMRVFGRAWPDHLHLRWPWVHMRMLRQYIGPAKNLSAERLQSLTVLPYYDGNRAVRLCLARLCQLPFLGRFFALLFSGAVLLETRTVRRA